MRKYLIVTVKKIGLPKFMEYDDEEQAMQAWQREQQRIGEHDLLGVGLEAVEEDGSLRPLQASWQGDGNLFVKRALQFRKRKAKRQ